MTSCDFMLGDTADSLKHIKILNLAISIKMLRYIIDKQLLRKLKTSFSTQNGYITCKNPNDKSVRLVSIRH